MAKVKIIGSGYYVPGEAINNEDLKKLAGIEFDAQKLESKIGIKNRHIAHLRGINETTADFATAAARKAIESAGLTPDQVNLFIVGTDTPEHISPATALLVQGRIQGKESFGAAFDVGASCASFTTALDVGQRMLQSDRSAEYAVVVGVYNMPVFVRHGDAFGYSIFADGAGALVLKKTTDDDPSGFIDSQFMVDGTQWDFIGVYAGGTKRPITKEVLDSNKYGLELIKPLPGERNIRLWPIIVGKLLEKNNLKVENIDHFIFTQINRYAIQQVMEALQQPYSKTTCVMDRFGYTGSACVPMAFCEALNQKSIKKGDKVVFVASGAGFAVGANLFVY